MTSPSIPAQCALNFPSLILYMTVQRDVLDLHGLFMASIKVCINQASDETLTQKALVWLWKAAESHLVH